MNKLMRDFGNACMMLGAYDILEKMGVPGDEVVRRVCTAYPVTPEELENLIVQWNDLIASGLLEFRAIRRVSEMVAGEESG